MAVTVTQESSNIVWTFNTVQEATDWLKNRMRFDEDAVLGGEYVLDENADADDLPVGEYEDYDDGQPTMYEEYQDLYGGDDSFYSHEDDGFFDY